MFTTTPFSSQTNAALTSARMLEPNYLVCDNWRLLSRPRSGSAQFPFETIQ